jgi:hypothetical protein
VVSRTSDSTASLQGDPAAAAAGHKVRYFTAAELAETVYRGLADNNVGRVIDTLLRNDLIMIDEVGFAPLDDTGAQLLFRVVAAARCSTWSAPRSARCLQPSRMPRKVAYSVPVARGRR